MCIIRLCGCEFTQSFLLIYILKNAPWIYDKDGDLHTSQDIIQENLAEEYKIYNGKIQLLGKVQHEKKVYSPPF